SRTPWVSSMSRAHFAWSVAPSTLSPSTFTLRRSNSPLSFATAPSSVVHTGVKSFGWLKGTAQDPWMWLYRWMGPSVESWVKSRAMSPSCSVIGPLLSLAGEAEKKIPDPAPGAIKWRQEEEKE